MLRYLSIVFGWFFEAPRCPWTRQPCPHPERCGLMLGGRCHFSEG